MERSSGILMHISSLPGKYGIGTFGKQAFSFIDFLKKSG
ncbi:4-alpha-glucanotransferase, partial [Clostridium sp.]